MPYARHLEERCPSASRTTSRPRCRGLRPPWSNSACRRWAPTWRRARWWSGWSSPATGEARRHRSRGRDQKGAIEIEIFETGTIEPDPGRSQRQGAGRDAARANSHRGGGRRSGCTSVTGAPSQSRRRQSPVAPPPAPIATLPLAAGGSAAARGASGCRRPRGGFAEQRGIDLAAIKGSGPGGAITYADVEHQLSAPPPAPEKNVRSASISTPCGPPSPRR